MGSLIPPAPHGVDFNPNEMNDLKSKILPPNKIHQLSTFLWSISPLTVRAVCAKAHLRPFLLVGVRDGSGCIPMQGAGVHVAECGGCIPIQGAGVHVAQCGGDMCPVPYANPTLRRAHAHARTRGWSGGAVCHTNIFKLWQPFIYLFLNTQPNARTHGCRGGQTSRRRTKGEAAIAHMEKNAAKWAPFLLLYNITPYPSSMF